MYAGIFIYLHTSALDGQGKMSKKGDSPERSAFNFFEISMKENDGRVEDSFIYVISKS